MSTASPSPGGIREIDWLSPEAREVLQLAGQKAQQRGAAAIYPEHLLLSILEQHSTTVSSLFQQSKLDLNVLRARTEASFPTPSSPTIVGQLQLAPELVVCIEQAIAVVTYHLAQNKGAALVLPEHLLLSIFYHPRMQGLFASFSTCIFQLKNTFMQQAEPAFARHMEQIFLFPEQGHNNQQKIVHFADLNKARKQHILRSIEYPDLTFKQILGLSRAKQAAYASIAFLRHPERYTEMSHGLLLFSQHPNDDLLFIRAIAGEARVPLSSIYCSVLVEMFLAHQHEKQCTQAELAEKAHQLIREVFYPIKLFSHCLIYFQDLEALALPESGQQKHYPGWRLLQKQFLTELDKLKQQRGTVVIASTTHPQHLHSELFRPGRLDKQIELYKPVQLLREEQKQGLPQLAHCPTCKHEVQSGWKHCVYCRTPLATRHCRNCGTPYPKVVGARFCPECGNHLH